MYEIQIYGFFMADLCLFARIFLCIKNDMVGTPNPCLFNEICIMVNVFYKVLQIKIHKRMVGNTL